jgi:hypothetical protein
MISIKNLALIAATISFISVTGGAIYEHAAVVPQWSAAPPVSLSMFQGPYGLNPGAFWRYIHPVTLLLLFLAIVLNWKTERRKYILRMFCGYVVILMVTFSYFVPELVEIITSPFTSTTDQSLFIRASRWETLSLIRLGFMVLISGGLAYALTKPETNKPNNK